jgi:hypothetical protein
LGVFLVLALDRFALRAFFVGAVLAVFLGVFLDGPEKMFFYSSSSVIARSLFFFVAMFPALGLARCNGAVAIRFHHRIGCRTQIAPLA